MKIRHVFLILFAFIASFTIEVSGQIEEVDRLMTRSQPNCNDITYNVSFLIPEYHSKGERDTLSAIMEYWEMHCGISEALFRTKLLLSIDNHSFSEELYDSTILNFLFNYKQLNNSVPQPYYRYNTWYYRGQSNETSMLDTFTVRLSEELLTRDDLTPPESFFAHFYSGNSAGTLNVLGTESYRGTDLQGYYCRELERTRKQVTGHFDLMMGSWIPYDNLKIIGHHPFFGIRGGIMTGRLTTDITLGFRLGDAANTYQVYEMDSLWNTTNFFGGYIGLDVGLKLFSLGKSQVDLIGGIAYDNIEVLDVEEPEHNIDVLKSLSSLNLNAGLGYKWYLVDYSYIGLEVKYNFVNYNNIGGTDLSGNTLTINLLYGFSGNKTRDDRLKLLDYTP